MYVSKHNGECRLLLLQELKYLKSAVSNVKGDDA